MPRTIDPSLLSRETGVKDVRRRLFESAGRKLPAPAPVEDNLLRQPTAPRKTDILVRAREMDKKIWAFTKLVKILEMLNDPDPFGTAAAPKPEEANLAQLLDKERTSGPSDRDPTVATKELIFFKGPYIYVYDIEEKQKPIMVREYTKVADKKDGGWPQFRSTQNGRCPFVEDDESLSERKRQAEKAARDKERQERVTKDAAPTPKPASAADAKSAVPKRTLTEMEDGHNTRSTSRVPDVFDLAKVTNPPTIDFHKPQAFTSRARSGRLLAGEPVASGLQKSNVTSAIRSQMISSATGIRGAKAGTSKELYGLQRKVLDKSNAPAANPTSQEMSSRRLADMSLDASNNQRSASLGVSSHKLAQIDENSKEHKRTLSAPAIKPAAKPKKRDMKPGYCENCQDKFADFDEVSPDSITLVEHRY
jgi:regulatory subunit for Cdc7p protein kinase